MKIIMKFGGSVLDNPSKINTVIDLTHSFKNMNGSKNDIICVISALSKVTDKILSLTDPIMKGNRDSVKIFIDEMTSIHIDLIEKTITNNSLKLEAKRIVLDVIIYYQDIQVMFAPHLHSDVQETLSKHQFYQEHTRNTLMTDSVKLVETDGSLFNFGRRKNVL